MATRAGEKTEQGATARARGNGTILTDNREKKSPANFVLQDGIPQPQAHMSLMESLANIDRDRAFQTSSARVKSRPGAAAAAVMVNERAAASRNMRGFCAHPEID